MRSLALLVAAFTLLSAALAHRMELNGNSQCFHETLNEKDMMSVTYEVADSASQVDFYAVHPRGYDLMRQVGQTQGTFVHTSQENTNRILYCFQARGHASVSFNVHGVRHMNDDDETAPVEQEVRDLASGLQLVKDEQSYLVVRERVHRNTCESTNSRVKWWAIAQIAILLSVCAWNIHYLKSWFEVKRLL